MPYPTRTITNLPDHIQAQIKLRMPVKKRSKYGNRKVIVDGILFDSMKEARVYSNLKLLQQAGQVASFERQFTYMLAVNGAKICKYIADFVVYYPDGKKEVWDVKSEITKKHPVYRLKKKLMLAIHGIDIVEK